MYIYQNTVCDIRYTKNEAFSLQTDPHVHGDYEFIYVISGTLYTNVGNIKMTANAGDCVLILPYQIHCYNGEKDTGCVKLNFPSEEVADISKTIARSSVESNVFQPDDVTSVLIRQYLLGQFPSSVCERKCILYAICGSFMKTAKFIPQVFPESSPAYHVITYIAEHYQENISLHEIARDLGYDYTYLSRTFCQTTGTSFRAFVNRHRLERACEALLNTTKAVGIIAHECGFQNIRSFYRAFRENLGVTPQEYRNL